MACGTVSEKVNIHRPSISLINGHSMIISQYSKMSPYSILLDYGISGYLKHNQVNTFYALFCET
jgi:hypothetical protein